MSKRPTPTAKRQLDVALPPPERPQRGLHNDYPDSPDPRKLIWRTPMEDIGPIGEPPYELDHTPEPDPERHTPPTSENS